MTALALIFKFLCCFAIGMAIGTVLCCIYELIKLCRSKPKELEYSVLDYEDAERTMQKYRDRAVEVYKLLDPGQKLLSGGYIGEFSYTPFVFKKGEKPELMVVLTFCDPDDEDSDLAESRQAWFPFELMNSDYISALNAADKINIEWEKKSYPYGGGGVWKMVARFNGPVNEQFLDNIRRSK